MCTEIGYWPASVAPVRAGVYRVYLSNKETAFSYWQPPAFGTVYVAGRKIQWNTLGFWGPVCDNPRSAFLNSTRVPPKSNAREWPCYRWSGLSQETK